MYIQFTKKALGYHFLASVLLATSTLLTPHKAMTYQRSSGCIELSTFSAFFINNHQDYSEIENDVTLVKNHRNNRVRFRCWKMIGDYILSKITSKRILTDRGRSANTSAMIEALVNLIPPDWEKHKQIRRFRQNVYEQLYAIAVGAKAYWTVKATAYKELNEMNPNDHFLKENFRRYYLEVGDLYPWDEPVDLITLLIQFRPIDVWTLDRLVDVLLDIYPYNLSNSSRSIALAALKELYDEPGTLDHISEIHQTIVNIIILHQEEITSSYNLDPKH